MKIFLFMLFFPCLLYAGNDQGNGGDGIYCVQKGKPTVQFYDLFEGSEVRGFHLQYPPPNLTERERLIIMLEPIKQFNPLREKRYLKWYDEFYDNIRFTTNDLIDIPDTNGGEIPPDCELKQVIIQKAPYYPNEKWYTIARRYWDMMDANSKLAAILHELILRDAVNNSGQINSVSTRYLNESLFNSDRILNLKSYILLMKFLKFKDAEAHGFPIYLGEDDQLRFYDDHTVEVAVGKSDIPFPLYGGIGTFIFDGVSEYNFITFNSVGKLTTLPDLTASQTTRFHTLRGLVYPNDNEPLFRAYYDKDGALLSVSAEDVCIEHGKLRETAQHAAVCGVALRDWRSYTGVERRKNFEHFVNGNWVLDNYVSIY
jgi:hypothetical protein